KVIRICHAVRAQGGKATVISLGRRRQIGSWKWYPASIRKTNGVPVIYASYWDAPLLTHVVSACSLLLILLKTSCRDSVLIFYNSLAYYVPSLIINRLMGRRCILDLEDGCRSDEKSPKGRLNHLLMRIHNHYCNGGAMLASSALMKQTPLRPTIVCYGVAPVAHSIKDWNSFPIKVLFGGALLKDTGAELFLDAMELLMSTNPSIGSKLKIIITGFGDISDKIQEAARTQLKSFIEYRGNVSNQEYIELLCESHVGLCLKLPDMSMGATTFPSKVIEMAAYGLLIVSTKVSDVPKVFSKECGVLLKQATPQNLSDVLTDIASSPNKYQEIALHGHEEITLSYSPQMVGSVLLNFWRGFSPSSSAK
ncbi:MAG: glycosyltransferase, partial [Desulfobacteraceae bacterium]|nr:glycosyltransferase [Desulfobacteraceae bacterium]